MSIFPEKTVKDVLAAIDAHKLLELINYRLDTVKDEQDRLKCFCPIHKEAVFRTLEIWTRDRTYRCTYSLCPGNAGGDLIDFYGRVKEISFDDALQELVEVLGIAVELPPAGEVVARTLEEGENFLYLVTGDDPRRDMYLEEAHKRFQRVLEVDPDNAKALKGMYQVSEYRGDRGHLIKLSWQLIEAESQSGRHEEVVELCRRHVELEPDNLEIRRRVIESLLFLEREKEAVDQLLALAELCETLQDFDGAIDAYHHVAKLDVVDIDVHPMIVNLLLATERNAEAVEECRIRAEWLAGRSQLASAMDTLRSALDIDPERDEIRVQLVEYSLVLGLDAQRTTEALTLVDEMISRDSLEPASKILHTLCEADSSNPSLLDKLLEVKKRQGQTEEVLTLQYRLADLYRDQEDYASAILLLEEISAATDGAIDALRRIAEIHRLEGDSDQAMEMYSQVVDRARKEERLDEAISAAEQMIEIQPEELAHQERLIELNIEAGRKNVALAKLLALIDALEVIGDAARLVKQLRAALDLAPDNTSLRIKLADALEGLGEEDSALDERMQAADQFLQIARFPEAIQQLETVLAKRQDDPRALSLMADALTHTGKNEESQDLLLRLANLHIAKEGYEDARLALERVLAQSPDRIDALEKLADVYTGLADEDKLVETLERLVAIRLKHEQWGEAETHCRTVLDLRADHIEAHRALARIHEQLERPDQVIETLLRLAGIFRKQGSAEEERKALETVLEKSEENRPALRRLAFLLLGAGEDEKAVSLIDRFIAVVIETAERDEAVDFLRELLELHEEQVSFHLRLIDLLHEAGRHREVVEQLTTLIEIHLKNERPEEVVDLYRRILELEPDNVEQRSHLIDVLLRLERRVEAIEEYLHLSRVYERQERYDDAERIGQAILKIDPDNERAHRRLVEISRARGDNDRIIEGLNRLSALLSRTGDAGGAIDTLREVFDIDPENVDTHRRIVDLQIERGDAESAIAEYKILVGIFQKAGDIENAIETQRQAIALLPEDPDLRRELIRIFTDLGDTEGAVGELFALADSLRRKERHEEALSTLAEVLDRMPDNIRARKLRGDIYVQMGREKEALRELLALTLSLENPDILRTLNDPRAIDLPEELPLVDEYVFDSFVVGDTNNFAYATALAAAKAPARQYNPLFLYSDVGLGKTHLLHAIGNYVRTANPTVRILYTTSEEFVSHLIDSIQNNTVSQFRHAHRDIDLLLLDDVQFLAGKERAQEEFFHIFNTLFQAKKQIVVTSDRPPKDIAHLEKRLKSRFGAGVVVDIHPPDIETRTAIVMRETQTLPDIGFTPEIISLIAQKIESNVRELKGAIRQVVASRELTGETLTQDMVARVLDQHLERV